MSQAPKRTESGLILERDRLVSLAVADFTDMALGLGSVRMAGGGVIFSSAHLRESLRNAKNAGMEIPPVEIVRGAPIDVDMMELCSVLLSVWRSREDFPYRYLVARTAKRGALEEIVFLGQGDFKGKRPRAGQGLSQLFDMMSLFGMRKMVKSGEFAWEAKASAAKEPEKIDERWAWARLAFEQSAEAKGKE